MIPIFSIHFGPIDPISSLGVPGSSRYRILQAAVLPEQSGSSTIRRRRLVGREVMPYVKAMATLERILQDGHGHFRSEWK